MHLVEILRKIKLIPTYSQNTDLEFKRIFLEFLNNTKDIPKDKYRVHPSTGMGNESKMWWVGIFNLSFYDSLYEIRDKRRISASKGYYIVYLFSEDKNKLFLTISHASTKYAGIYKDATFEDIKFVNQYLYEKIFGVNIYKSNIDGQLSINLIKQASYFENGVIIAKEYDLINDISDSEFRDDLKIFIKLYEQLADFLTENTYIFSRDYFIDCLNFKIIKIKNNNESFDFNSALEEYRNNLLVQEVNPYNQSELDSIIMQEYIVPIKLDHNYTRYKTNPRLTKTKLKSDNYMCSCGAITIYDNHNTFLTPQNYQYAEGHHLIPIAYQEMFLPNNLDCLDNIVTLCPICHNAVHYGNIEEKIKRLEPLYRNSNMKYILKDKGINDFVDFFNQFYN